MKHHSILQAVKKCDSAVLKAAPLQTPKGVENEYWSILRMIGNRTNSKTSSCCDFYLSHPCSCAYLQGLKLEGFCSCHPSWHPPENTGSGARSWHLLRSRAHSVPQPPLVSMLWFHRVLLYIQKPPETSYRDWWVDICPEAKEKLSITFTVSSYEISWPKWMSEWSSEGQWVSMMALRLEWPQAGGWGWGRAFYHFTQCSSGSSSWRVLWILQITSLLHLQK